MVIGMACAGMAQAQALKVPPAPPQPMVFHNRLMVNVGSGECMVPDIDTSTPTSRRRDRYRPRPKPPGSTGPAKPGLLACSFDQAQNQLWQWVGVGQDENGTWDTFVIQSASQRACLGVENRSNAEGAALARVNCDLSDPSQMWIRQTNSSDLSRPAPATAWINVNSGKCITAFRGPERPTLLRQFTCQHSPGFDPQEFYGIVF
jgi:hypothetical protein